MDLSELIEYLEERDPNQIIELGFSAPHYHRNHTDYESLAFEPTRDIRVKAILLSAKRALGETFQGCKPADSMEARDSTEVCLGFLGEKHSLELTLELLETLFDKIPAYWTE